MSQHVTEIAAGWGVLCLVMALISAVVRLVFSDGNKYPRFHPPAGTAVRSRSRLQSATEVKSRPRAYRRVEWRDLNIDGRR